MYSRFLLHETLFPVAFQGVVCSEAALQTKPFFAGTVGAVIANISPNALLRADSAALPWPLLSSRWYLLNEVPSREAKKVIIHWCSNEVTLMKNKVPNHLPHEHYNWQLGSTVPV
ncbi:hypothetical protein ElyMa_005085000 [Elysia marginata]|uniref:Uncharacterized protein n=1 Tax=Elysia marginata TaxID=1093978 RepID=A0AAV4JFA6_9GAST|nr:hypothetical protein ElyMa_005085000 [Elysia marginata]